MNVETLFNSYRERSTAKLQFECDMDLIVIPPIERGSGIALFKVGDRVITTDKASLIQGIELTIKEIYFNEAGYPQYIMEEKTGIYAFRDQELELRK